MGESGVSRRSFLVTGGAAAAGIALAGCRWVRPPAHLPAPVPLPTPPFTLGVASGDPLADGIVLWTRLAPEPLAGGGMPDRRVPVRWEVASDERCHRVVRAGWTVAEPENAHSVHVDVRGLAPDRVYWYRFAAGGHVSPIGRTRTAPRWGMPAGFAFAFASCQSWTDGYFTAYSHLAQEDVRFVAHLGDYIYEGGVGGADAVRNHNSAEVTDLAAYRNRYALYKGDPDLQAAHAACPWIVTWDDHEADNDYAGLIPEATAPPVDFVARRAAAYRAWWEHQPVRIAPPVGPDLRIYRRVGFGGLLDVFVLDTRQYRTDQQCGIATFSFGPRCEGTLAETATLTGPEQEAWLRDGLGHSQARWNVIAQQVMVGQVNYVPAAPGGIFNNDQWDGYVAARRRFVDAIAQRPPGSTFVLTGDIHSSWVNDLRRDFDDPAAPVVAPELVGTSITSSFPAELQAIAGDLIAQNPSIRYFDPLRRGYVRVALDPDQARADYRSVDTVTEPTSGISTSASWVIAQGVPAAQPA